MNTRLFSLREFDDEDDPLPIPAPLPVIGDAPPAGPTRTGGALVFRDGSAMVITHRTVIGRDPTADDRVKRGEVAGALLHGGDLVVSRAHAEIAVSTDGVAVVDLGSTNGTMVRRVDSDRWERLLPGVAQYLRPGDSVSFAGLECRFDLVNDLGEP